MKMNIKKILLVIFHGLIVVFGLTLFIMGVVGMVSKTQRKDTFRGMLDKAVVNLDQSAVPTEYRNQLSQFVLEGLRIISVPTLVMGLLLMGFGMLVIATFACYHSRKMVFIVMVANFCIIIIFLFLISAFYNSESLVKSMVNKKMTHILKKYTGIPPKNVETLFMVVFQQSKGCCGVTNGGDYKKVTTWTRNISYGGLNFTMEYPFSCCKLKNKVPVDMCPVTHHMNNSNFANGCGVKMYEFFQSNRRTVTYFILIIVLVQIVVISFSSCVFAEEKYKGSHMKA